MMQILLIGVSAGAAAALLFAASLSGSLAALLLIYVAPLPILIAGIGWNYPAGLIAALVAAVGIGVMFDGTSALAYVINIALPAWWLAYLTLLARPAQAQGEKVEWYPPGQILLWAAVAGIAASMTIFIAFLGPDFDSIKANLRTSLEYFVKFEGNDINADALMDSGAFAKIAAATMAWMLTALVTANTWLAAKIVKLSGRLRRSWPDLSAMRVPAFTLPVFAASLAGILLPGLPGMAAATVTGAMIVLFAVLGLVLLHAVTRGIDARPFILGGVYILLIFFNWLVCLPLALLGLADTALDLRGRSAAAGGPPTRNF